MKNQTISRDHEISLQDEITEIIRMAESRSESEAARLAAVVVEGLRRRRGGDTLYIPTGIAPGGRRQRDQAIRSEFNGRNIRELCAKHRLSRSRMYDILRSSR